MSLTVLARSSLSSSPIRVPVSAKVNGAFLNVTTMAAKFAFKPDGTDPSVSVAGDWTTGTWDTDATGSYPIYKAQVTPPALAKGSWIVWLWLDGASDDPVSKVAVLQLT